MEIMNQSIIILKEVIALLKTINKWQKFTPTHMISTYVDNMFFEIRNDTIYWNRKDLDSAGMWRIDVTDLIQKMLKELKQDDLKELYIIKEEIDKYITYLYMIFINIKPVIQNIFAVNFDINNNFITFYWKDNTKTRKKFENFTIFEKYVNERMDNIEAFIYNKITYPRHSFLTKEYLEFEYKILLEQEQYEMLAWFKKIKEKYGS